ncbi:MAG: S-(hydroxymethyl)glutathione dehydrogenase / alcohol dehydrogenase [Pseudonocardiales bacterium]|jgi:S-(hydroxymethyl)glutathione dehydrogenase/alcohol dehydrogenase|nr:S-(hydroxymethyl)glutathione dehydrogenase / alcohol dehydrogenase [Pseudonocardiales bacterium]MDT4931133.1 S-(hydroxymethyl)glutathione dehydrogenase / alcohol dehydrogenase [Pseudonocardiales bacterium]MDT4950349.1 S-(hydroxymethyl)glutathione dehydrogenase / alcohol dehydrogenase [Pseudonocardiales bacterium]
MPIVETITVPVPVLRAVGRPMLMEEVAVAPPGPGEVRVRMAASGVCHSCLHVADGSHGGLPFPIVLGDEGAGVVEAVGAHCSRVRVGDPVILSWAPSCGWCRFCSVGRPVLCLNGAPGGFMTDGTTRFTSGGQPVHHLGPATYAPYVVVHESAAITIDPTMPLDRAALIGCAVATGVGAVVNTAQARPGSSLAVFGCGGVGLNAIQGGVIVGANPIVGVDVLAARTALATTLGATAVVDAASVDAVEELRALSGGGFDVTVVAVGHAGALEQAWSVTGRGGICVLVGKPPDGVRIDFDPQTLLAGERRLTGSVYGSSRPAVDFPALVGLYLAGRLKLDELITRRYHLNEANEAFDALRDGDQARGLIVY